MFKFFIKSKHGNGEKDQEKNNKKYDEVLKKSLEKNISLFKQIFENDETLIIREFQNKRLRAAKCCILYIDGMVNTEMITENIIKPVLRDHLSDDIESYNLFAELKNKVIISNNVSSETAIDKIIGSVIGGDTLFLLEGYAEALIIASKGWQTKQISEPESAKVVRGPREGFTESIMVNLSLTRRKIKSPDLKFKFKEIGERTHTRTCICYIEGLAYF